MSDDIMLTCQSVTEIDGYPILRKVFRHLARTPRSFAVWVETERPGPVRFLLMDSFGNLDEQSGFMLNADGLDVFIFEVQPGFEGSIGIAMIDEVAGAERCVRDVHFRGLSWQSE